MQLEDYFEFLGPNEIKLQGHRIWMEHILYEYIFHEMTAQELHERFPTLTLDKIYAALLYYHQHKEEMDKYLADWLEYCRKAREADRQRIEEDRRLRPEYYADRKRRWEKWMEEKKQQDEVTAKFKLEQVVA